MVVTIPFSHVTNEGNIFLSCPLDKSGDCTSTTLLEHVTSKKIMHIYLGTKISNSYSPLL